MVGTRARLARLALEKGAHDWKEPPFVVTEAEVTAAMEAGSDSGDRAVAEWLWLEPTPAVVGEVLKAGNYRVTDAIVEALRQWSEKQSRKERTNLLARLIRVDRDTSQVIAPLVRAESDEKALVEAVRAKMEKVSSSADRSQLARKAVALAPQSGSSQRKLAETVLWLLDEKRPKSDIDPALILIGGLRREQHGSKRALDKALASAAGRASRKLSKEEIAHIRGAGLVVPEKFVRKGWWDWIDAR
jgi:hypothetical protein